MPAWLKKGIIQEYLPKQKHGWILGEDQQLYYFHLGGRRRIVAGFTQPVFHPPNGLLLAPFRSGDSVVFRPGSTANGPKAEIWGFASEYERAAREIAGRQAKPAPAQA